VPGRARISLTVLVVGACVAVPSASAGWAGGDPAANYAAGALPSSCKSAPLGKECVDAGIYYLDRARAALGQPSYELPADFPSLTPAEQTFILTNLDRVLYGLPPITGLTDALNHDAQISGVASGEDPVPTDPSEEDWYTSNWAGGFANVPLVYEAWMYDDGLGSSNVTCTAGDPSGCWGHRHDILWEFDPTDVLAMGAAAGKDTSGSPGYALILFGGNPPNPDVDDPGYQPVYSYTWEQAVADGAGTNAYNPGVPKLAVCAVPNVAKKTLAQARHLVTAAHCQVGKITKAYSRARKGSVVSQKPGAGAKLSAGAKVNLVVSKGKKPHR
jgi:hypothetical protein